MNKLENMQESMHVLCAVYIQLYCELKFLHPHFFRHLTHKFQWSDWAKSVLLCWKKKDNGYIPTCLLFVSQPHIIHEEGQCCLIKTSHIATTDTHLW